MQMERTNQRSANDAEVCAKVDTIIGQNPEPPGEEPGNVSMIEPHGKIAAQLSKKQRKRLRQRQDQPRVLDNGMVSFWHDGKHRNVQ